MADVLENCAVDPTHQPAIYSAFIREIVRKTRDSRSAENLSGVVAAATAVVNGTAAGAAATAMANAMYDPQLMSETANWQPGDQMMGPETAQFQFIPQGGDMM